MKLTPDQRQELEYLLAYDLDLPSIYMGGPTPPSRRKAKMLMDRVENYYETCSMAAELSGLLDEEERLQNALASATTRAAAEELQQSLEVLCLRIETLRAARR